MRSNCFGGKLIRNDQYIGQGRTPWSYRAGGSMVKPNDEQMRYPRICAHRGFNTVAPENSLPAFGAAIALGAQEIELDVWMTKDGVPVVAHDESVDRVSDGHGKITEMTFDELRRLDFGALMRKRSPDSGSVVRGGIEGVFPADGDQSSHQILRR